MKILIPLITLVQLSTASASLVAVMDSGTDISHKDLAPKAWVNKNERPGNVDLDKDGLPGDINGWDFTEKSAKVFNNRYNNLITADVKTFFNYYSKFETGQLTQTSPEYAWLKTHSSDATFMSVCDFIGGYIHGTHVAGISLLNNPRAQVLSMKIIPTVYQAPNATRPGTPTTSDTTPAKTVADYSKDVVTSATEQITEMVNLHNYLAFHKVDVANQSFGIGYGDAVKFITAGFIKDVKRKPTEVEVQTLVKAYFAQLLKEGPKMFNAAPNTLFVIAAGNDSSNNDLYPDYPADIQAANKIVVAATNGYKALADFSNYGATRVDMAAPGVAITSTAPTNTYIPLSGTSQATPYVTNTIALIKDLNPALSARDIKAIVLGTVDVKTWLRGKVKASGILNQGRALKAAEFAKSQTVDLAISKARATVADIPVAKSFSFVKPAGLNLNYKPHRPSLLVGKSDLNSEE